MHDSLLRFTRVPCMVLMPTGTAVLVCAEPCLMAGGPAPTGAAAGSAHGRLAAAAHCDVLRTNSFDEASHVSAALVRRKLPLRQ